MRQVYNSPGLWCIYSLRITQPIYTFSPHPPNMSSLTLTHPTPAHPLTVAPPQAHPLTTITEGVNKSSMGVVKHADAHARPAGAPTPPHAVDTDGYSADIDDTVVEKMFNVSVFHDEGVVFKTRFGTVRAGSTRYSPSSPCYEPTSPRYSPSSPCYDPTVTLSEFTDEPPAHLECPLPMFTEPQALRPSKELDEFFDMFFGKRKAEATEESPAKRFRPITPTPEQEQAAAEYLKKVFDLSETESETESEPEQEPEIIRLCVPTNPKDYEVDKSKIQRAVEKALRSNNWQRDNGYDYLECSIDEAYDALVPLDLEPDELKYPYYMIAACDDDERYMLNPPVDSDLDCFESDSETESEQEPEIIVLSSDSEEDDE